MVCLGSGYSDPLAIKDALGSRYSHAISIGHGSDGEIAALFNGLLELEVLRLPAVERARLLDRIVASLDADKARDLAWDRVAAERDAELDDGTAFSVSGAEAVARLRADLD